MLSSPGYQPILTFPNSYPIETYLSAPPTPPSTVPWMEPEEGLVVVLAELASTNAQMVGLGVG